MGKLNFEDFIEHYLFLKRSKTSFVSLTLTDVIGSAPQVIGARMIVTENGLSFGSIGGGKFEKKMIEDSLLMIKNRDSKALSKKFNLQTDIGMTCGGVVGVFIEPYIDETTLNIAVFGAGHIAQEFVPLACKLNANVFCIDTRLDWLNKIPESKNLQKIHKDKISDYVEKLPDNTFLISMTMGHAFDMPVLSKALKKRNFPFVGVIGSHQKAKIIKNELKQLDISDEIIQQLHCPVGEDFGDNSPYEISLSIICQILKLRKLD